MSLTSMSRRQVYGVFALSPHAHARIFAVDKTAAEQLPGVHAVVTGQAYSRLRTWVDRKGFRTKLPPLAQDRVHFGERAAVVIAATEALARDAAELVSVDYEVLPAVVSAEDAVRPGGPLIHEDAAVMTIWPSAPSPGRIMSRGCPSTTIELPPSPMRHPSPPAATRRFTHAW